MHHKMHISECTMRFYKMAPKTKFTRDEMIKTALSVVREKGDGELSARAVADRLGTSTRPVFTCFETMENLRAAVLEEAEKILDGYLMSSMRSNLAFFGVGMAYIRFAREEKRLFRLLFFSNGEALKVMERIQELTRPAMKNIYNLSDDDADFYFDNLWLITHSYATLIATDCCPYSDGEIAHSISLMSLSLCKALKEIPGFRHGGYDKDLLFRELIDGKTENDRGGSI